MVEVLLCVLAATAYALGSVLQRRGAISAPRAERHPFALVVALLRRPVWLAGIAAMILGVALQAVALHGGAIAFVEPILVVELPATLLLAALMFRAKLDWHIAVTILVMSGALAALLLLASPGSGHVGSVSGFAWVVSLAATGGVMATLVVVGRRLPPAGRAALLGIAAGVGHGLSATLLKATTMVAAQDIVSLFTTWKLYAAIVAGGASLYLFQVALQSGPLVAGQAGLNILDPLISTCFGLALFGEHVRTGPFAAGEAAAVLVLVAAIIVLARSPLLHGEQARPTGTSARGERRERVVS